MRRYGAIDAAIKEALLKWPGEMVDHAVNAALVIHSLRPSPSAKLLIETRISLKHIAPGLYGTLDYAWVESWGTLVVVDYKYGAGVVVEPEEDGEYNSQLLYYATGLAKQFDYDFEKVRLAVIQPRVYEDDVEPLAIVDAPIKALREFETKVLEAYRKSLLPNAPLKAGDHCRWCPAQAECPEINTTMVKADIVFDVEDGLQAVPEPLALSSAAMPKLLDACRQLELWIDAVRARALYLADKQGVEIPGYKLVNKRATYVWNADAEKAAHREFGSGAYETAKRLLTPAQIKKVHKAKGKEFVKKHTTAIVNGVSLVPEKDKRAEVVETGDVFDFET